MIVEIIKGLKYFYAMVLVVFIAFATALINLFRARPSVGDGQQSCSSDCQ